MLRPDPIPQAPGRDTRFSTIEDAAALLRLLPATEKIAWPIEPGDVAELDATLRWLGEWLPAARRSWRCHKALLPKRGKLRAVTSGGGFVQDPPPAGGRWVQDGAARG